MFGGHNHLHKACTHQKRHVEHETSWEASSTGVKVKEGSREVRMETVHCIQLRDCQKQRGKENLQLRQKTGPYITEL